MARRRSGRRYGGYGDYDSGWRPYVPVAARRAKARAYAQELANEGREISPVEVKGRKITRTFWGDAWCRNLERYSDYANRLPRGRTYVRNGSVIHLGISKGKVEALVSGSEIYEVEIDVSRTPPKKWKALCKECAGRIDSLVDLLRGRLSEGVMERICQSTTGLFPAPREIHLRCSCPDWADMCKHVAAVLYGVGCRLDMEPELLFRLRAVDEGQMIAEAAGSVSTTGKTRAPENALADDGSLDEIFGIDLAGADDAPPKARRGARKTSTRRATKKTKPRKRAAAAKKTAHATATRKKAKAKTKARARTQVRVAKAAKPKTSPARKKAAGTKAPAKRTSKAKTKAAVKARASAKTGGKTAAAKRKAKTTSRKKPAVRKSGAKRKKTGRRNA